MKFYGLTIEQWSLLFGKIDDPVIKKLEPHKVLPYCRKNKITIPCEKIEKIIGEDVRPRDYDSAFLALEKAERHFYGLYRRN